MVTSRRMFIRWFLMATAMVGLLGGCATLPKAKVSLAEFPAEQVVRARHNLAVFNAAWDLVNRKHYDPKFQGVNWEEAAATYGPRAAAATDDVLLYTIINDMLGLLHDSHTHALTRGQTEERHTHLRARTGFSMARIDSKWVVTEVIEGTPAYEAGVKPGWIVIARDGRPLGERVDFRFKEGQEVQWEYLDEHDRRVVVSPRAKRLSTAARQIERPLADGFIYLRFDEFDGIDRRWLSRRLKAHRNAPGVVIDLRLNPGGDTFSLGTAVGEFFGHAVPCGTFITRGGTKAVQNSWQIGSAHYSGKVAVLIDAGTGSAAEIFTAVLQDHGRATIIGRQTAGAVLASWFYRLPDGGELQLSRMDYVTPKGRRIEGNGIRPDIEIPRTLGDLRAGRDRDLEEAMKVLRGRPTAARRDAGHSLGQPLRPAA